MATVDNILETGELEILGRLVDASNASLLCKLPNESQVIYKPIAGERPLWDFPDGNLASREVAAFYVSEIGEFGVVPQTIMRDGPFGLGAVQEWITTAEDIDVIEIAQSSNERIRNLALFDIIINNADRKFGHILVTPNLEIFGCDHGVSFHQENKLRTVIWQFSELDLTREEISKIEQLISRLDRAQLSEYLSDEEVDALFQRANTLLDTKKFAQPNPNWPAVPWPPY
jgi:uncharacterized repeat protein (TIGR03843 family)